MLKNVRTIGQIEHAECCLCGERLTDPESIKRGTGPVCATKLTSFMAAVGSSAEEIAALALVDDSAVARWLRVAGRAFGAGHIKQARGFLDAARKSAAVATESVGAGSDRRTDDDSLVRIFRDAA